MLNLSFSDMYHYRIVPSIVEEASTRRYSKKSDKICKKTGSKDKTAVQKGTGNHLREKNTRNSDMYPFFIVIFCAITWHFSFNYL